MWLERSYVSTFYKGINDTMFKTIFSNPNNRHLLKKLLQDALKLEDIKILEVNTLELPKMSIYRKKKTLDVVVKSTDKIINIEVVKLTNLIRIVVLLNFYQLKKMKENLSIPKKLLVIIAVWHMV